jgi:tRNA 2-selenouridine synthase
MREDTDDYARLFLEGVPMMDVRAPIEFAKGAFPGVINLPLMNDAERQKVGTCYKQHGQQAAINLGHRLVSGDLKAERIEAWSEFTRRHPDGFLYCFRGGLRSQLVQQWLSDAGIQYPRVRGGYKCLRRFLIDTLERAVEECPLTLVAGLTGTGKTEVIARLEGSLDLERHAHHRGSSFGRHATPQPVQIDFENALAIELLRVRHAGYRHLVLEDEGRMVGSCSIPLELYQKMLHSPLVWLEEGLDARVSRILRDYVIDMHAEHLQLFAEQPEQAFDAFADYLQGSLLRIRKRLGGERHQRLDQLMREALDIQRSTGQVEAHRGWIEGLLNEYYDPMYAYQRSAKEERVIFSGDQQAVVEFLRERTIGSVDRG